MSDPDRVSIDILVLNYNGRRLLAECLPSVLTAAARSRHACRVGVVDNSVGIGHRWVSTGIDR